MINQNFADVIDIVVDELVNYDGLKKLDHEQIFELLYAIAIQRKDFAVIFLDQRDIRRYLTISETDRWEDNWTEDILQSMQKNDGYLLTDLYNEVRHYVQENLHD